MTAMRFLVLLAILPLAAGCDKELLAGGQGEVEIIATDEPPEQHPSFSISPTSSPGGGPLAQVVPQVFTGTVDFEVAVSLLHTSGEVVDVITPPADAMVTIGQNQPVGLGIRRIPDGRYTVVRMAFNRVDATLTAGPGVIGTRSIDVDFGPEPFVVERLVDLVIGVTERETLQINLNAGTWLLLEQMGLVDRDHFGSSVRVRVVT